MGYWRSIDSALSATRGQARQAVTLARKAIHGQVVAVVTCDRQVNSDGYARGCVIVTDTLIVTAAAPTGFFSSKKPLVINRGFPHPVTVTDAGDDITAVEIAGLPVMWCTPSDGALLRGLLIGEWPLVVPPEGPTATDVERERHLWVFVGAASVVALITFILVIGANHSRRGAPSPPTCEDAKAAALQMAEESDRAVRLLTITGARTGIPDAGAGETFTCVGTGYFSDNSSVAIKFGYKTVGGDVLVFYAGL